MVVMIGTPSAPITACSDDADFKGVGTPSSSAGGSVILIGSSVSVAVSSGVHGSVDLVIPSQSGQPPRSSGPIPSFR